MRQWMDNVIAMRTMTNEFLGRVRNEVQAPSRTDIDTVMLAVRHMEKRLLDRLDEVSAQILKANSSDSSPPRARSRRAGSKARRAGAHKPPAAEK